MTDGKEEEVITGAAINKCYDQNGFGATNALLPVEALFWGASQSIVLRSSDVYEPKLLRCSGRPRRPTFAGAGPLDVAVLVQDVLRCLGLGARPLKGLVCSRNIRMVSGF